MPSPRGTNQRQGCEDYLDGRPLSRTGERHDRKAVAVCPGDTVVKTTVTGQPVTMTTRTLIMKRSNISALSVGKAERANDVAWITPVAFLYKDGSNTTAVEAIVEHSASDGKTLFLGFQIRRVAKQ